MLYPKKPTQRVKGHRAEVPCETMADEIELTIVTLTFDAADPEPLSPASEIVGLLELDSELKALKSASQIGETPVPKRIAHFEVGRCAARLAKSATSIAADRTAGGGAPISAT